MTSETRSLERRVWNGAMTSEKRSRERRVWNPRLRSDMAKRKIEDEIELTKRQIAKLELKVNEYRSQLRRMKEGPSKDKVRQEALPVLKKKKKLEIKLENLGIQLENLCQQQQRVQNSRENKQTVNAMKMGTKALKKLNKRTSKEDVEDVMDKTAAFVEQSDQVQQIFGRLSSLYPECSAEDLEAELDALSDDSEVLEEEGTSLLNNTVIAPDSDSVVAGPPQHINDVQDGQPSIQDEHGDPAEIGVNGNPSSSDRRNNEDQEPGIGVVPVPAPILVPVVAPPVIPAVLPVPAPPVPSGPLPKFSSKKSGDKLSRDKKNEEKKENKKKDKKDKDKKKRKTEQDERDAEEPDRDNNKECGEEDDHCDKEDDRDHDRPDPPKHSSDSSSHSEEEEKDGKKESRWKKFKRTFSFKRKASSKSNAVLQRQKYHVDSNDYGPSTTGTELSQQHTLMSRPMEDNSEINVQNYPPPSRQPRRQAPPPPSPSHSDQQHGMDSRAASTYRGSQHGKTSSPPTRPPPYHTTKTQDHKSPLHRSYTVPSSSSRSQHSESPSTPMRPPPPRTKSLGNDPSFQPRRPAPPPPGSDSSSRPSRPKRPAPPPPETQRQYTDDSHRGHTPQQDVTSQQCNKEDVQEKEFLQENDQFAEKYYSPNLEPDYLPGSEKDNMPEQDYIPPTATYSRFCTLY